jgi:hypothetical protein
MTEKVLNVGECHCKHVMLVGGALCGYNSIFDCPDLHITHVQIIRNRTKTSNGGLAGAAGQISGTILAGLIGYILTAPQTSTTWDMDLDIYTKEGKVIELWTSDHKIIKYLSGYMTVEDPRDKYRKQRGVL